RQAALLEIGCEIVELDPVTPYTQSSLAQGTYERVGRDARAGVLTAGAHGLLRRLQDLRLRGRDAKVVVEQRGRRCRSARVPVRLRDNARVAKLPPARHCAMSLHALGPPWDTGKRESQHE